MCHRPLSSAEQTSHGIFPLSLVFRSCQFCPLNVFFFLLFCFLAFSSTHSYAPAKDAVCEQMGLTDEDVQNITGGTAQALFGSWTAGA